jgi:TusA-related sulfurtransferase
METNKKPLMKHFASVLRKRALATTQVKASINPQILKFFTRKDLIQIITDKYDGTIPKQHKLVEMENGELLSIIGDDMYIISYMTQKWCEESQMKNALIKSVAQSNSQKGNTKVQSTTGKGKK